MKSIFHCIVAFFVIATFSACNNDSQSEAANGGDVSNSNLTFYSMTPSDSEPAVTPLAITDITCEIDSDNRAVRIDLGEEGHVLVRDDHRFPEQAWLIVINLTRLDIPGGKRANIIPSRSSHEFNMDEAGNIQGTYGFQLFGDLEGQYGVEMDIRC